MIDGPGRRRRGKEFSHFGIFLLIETKKIEGNARLLAYNEMKNYILAVRA